MTPTRWPAETAAKANPWPHPPMMAAIMRGLKGSCPACGQGRIFDGFLKVVPACSACGAPLGLARADDAPPYLTILVAGHIIVPLLYWMDRMGEPPLWLMSAIFLPLTLALCLGLLRPIKGATVGVMVNLDMLKSTPPG